MKSYNIIHAILILSLCISSSLKISPDWWSDQFIEIQSIHPSILEVGQPGMAIFEITTLDDYHIMANQEHNDNLLFTQVEFLDTIDGMHIGAPQFPIPEELSLGGTQYSMAVFSGNFEIVIPIDVRVGVGSGDYSIRGILTYQPCDKQKCYFPREAEFVISVEVR